METVLGQLTSVEHLLCTRHVPGAFYILLCLFAAGKTYRGGLVP